MTYYVYALMDPINNRPFYIGKGTKDRIHDHLSGKDRSNRHKVYVIDTLRNLGIEPYSIKIVDNITEESTAYELESFFIRKLCCDARTHLTNIAGTKSDYVNRRHVRKKQIYSDPLLRSFKISRALKGKPSPKKGTTMPEAIKQKIAEKLKGREPAHKRQVNVDDLRHLYLDVNLTKSEVCIALNIGLGTLNRVLAENHIKKT